ncbi:hypothetical protein ROTAS13_02340 [Roseomonas sp. TAS13]|jgi:hypothetical protein|uniref:Uncharacterized protein n=2 Tax=Muricoccus TaxID=3409995 RepID=A0A840YBE2_9PROT|nr:hypothetical protein [Roseomonas pecuniae]GAV34671.1 hypothetical protein ROTAS13_02340 [Roseomonas sp. TAS13]SHK40262.1 hypothetical protein SAMN02745194_04844 [Roseomonas rosea]
MRFPTYTILCSGSRADAPAAIIPQLVGAVTVAWRTADCAAVEVRPSAADAAPLPPAGVEAEPECPKVHWTLCHMTNWPNGVRSIMPDSSRVPLRAELHPGQQGRDRSAAGTRSRHIRVASRKDDSRPRTKHTGEEHPPVLEERFESAARCLRTRGVWDPRGGGRVRTTLLPILPNARGATAVTEGGGARLQPPAPRSQGRQPVPRLRAKVRRDAGLSRGVGAVAAEGAGSPCRRWPEAQHEATRSAGHMANWPLRQTTARPVRADQKPDRGLG